MHRVSSLHTCELRYSDDSTPRASRTQYSSEIARVRSRAKEGRLLGRLEDINLRNKRDTRSDERASAKLIAIVFNLRCEYRYVKAGATTRPRNLRRLIDTRLHVIARFGRKKKRRDNYCSVVPLHDGRGKIYMRADYDRPVVRKCTRDATRSSKLIKFNPAITPIKCPQCGNSA